MKYLAALFLIVILSLNLFAQSDWNTYPARSIAEIIDAHSGDVSKKTDFVVSAAPFPSKTSAIYTGKHRPISEETKKFISLWVQTRNVPTENAEMLVEEFLFREKEKEYWIPVINKVTPVLSRELKEGDEITIYYFFLGGYKSKEDKIEWIFAVEAFQKSSYKIQSIAEASKTFEIPSDKINFLIAPRQIKSKSKVIFTGEIRNVSEKKILFLKSWAEKVKAPAEVVELFRQEACFREVDKDYWLPVRKSILEEMQKQLKKGDSVEIHTILAGGIPQANSFEWIFIVGEFTR